MPEIGRTLSHFRIVEKIGEGGMGQVYLADDTTLDRKVALKFLPEAFTSDPERMARFEREAKLLASLNHPNIAAIYGLERADGVRFLVLEYVEGETLQARLSKGALPLEDALALCRQIAEGLDSAHEKGVIHRDLKPANVMITAEEKIKILDFGLAKAFSDDTQSIDSSQSPTLTEAMTRPGVILGTAAYMSPEQAKGKSIDKRADIWAFGCILYECLTGKKAFEGETVTETLAAVITREPEWNRTPLITHAALHRCLEKDPKKRLRAIGEAMAWMEYQEEASASVPSATKRPWFAWSIAAVSILALAVGIFIYSRNEDLSADKPTYFHFLPPSLSLAPEGSFAISPDGRYLAFAAIDSNGIKSLWAHDFSTNKDWSLPGTESDYIPPVFWSPNSRFIGFTTTTDSKLKKIDIKGSPPKDICDLPHYAVGGSWNKNDEIILGMLAEGLMLVSPDGSVSLLAKPNPDLTETNYFWPVFLSDGKHFLFQISATKSERSGLYVGSLDIKPEEQNAKLLMTMSRAAVYVPSPDSRLGRLLFIQDQALMAQSFDENSLDLIGESVQVADKIRSYMGFSFFSASMNGRLIYNNGNAGLNKVIWYDRQGNPLGQAGKYGECWGLCLSPDNKHAVFSWFNSSRTWEPTDIWIQDLARDSQIRFTFGEGQNYGPVWSPDGNQIIFASIRTKGTANLFQKQANGTGDAKLLFESSEMKDANSFSRDSRLLLFTSINPETRADLWVLHLDEKDKAYSILNTEFNEFDGQISPDMNWIAYTSDETGKNGVYIRRLSQGSGGVISIEGEKHLIGGGIGPRWRRDGKEFYYRASDGYIRSVEMTPGTTFRMGTGKILFKAPVVVPKMADSYISFYWDVSEDGSRFFMPANIKEGAESPFNVILNWTSLLDK